jgi:hypothetical protein
MGNFHIRLVGRVELTLSSDDAGAASSEAANSERMSRGRAIWTDFWGSLGGRAASVISTVLAIPLAIIQHNWLNMLVPVGVVCGCLLVSLVKLRRPPPVIFVPYHVTRQYRWIELTVYSGILIAALIAFGVIAFPLERLASEGREFEAIARELESGFPGQRLLTSQQRAVLTERIHSLRGHSVRVVAGGLEPESLEYAKQFFALFKREGLDVGADLQQEISVTPLPAISVECQVAKGDNSRMMVAEMRDASILRSAMVEAGLLDKSSAKVSRCEISGSVTSADRYASVTIGSL